MMDVEVGDLRVDEMQLAVGVLARGMRDIPMHVSVYGDDPDARLRGLETLFRVVLPVMPWPPLCARCEGTLVGILGMSPPHAPMPPLGTRLAMIPPLFLSGPRSFMRLNAHLSGVVRRSPKEPHWHVGPVAVDAPLQGRGIGGQMMRAFCARMDELEEVAYLETDTAENVIFYSRFGFVTIDEADILGIHNWFMRRIRAAAR
jgi:GNAT superfamily N-acetyltransferase